MNGSGGLACCGIRAANVEPGSVEKIECQQKRGSDAQETRELGGGRSGINCWSIWHNSGENSVAFPKKKG